MIFLKPPIILPESSQKGPSEGEMGSGSVFSISGMIMGGFWEDLRGRSQSERLENQYVVSKMGGSAKFHSNALAQRYRYFGM